MKKIGLLFLGIPLLLFTSCEKEDKCLSKINGICITDVFFFNELIRNGVDTDGDGIIGIAEAEATTKLEIVTRDVEDMKGIEAFINLDTLICGYNFFDLVLGALTSLDISNNTELLILDCSDNQLTSLDVSNNTELNKLSCGRNSLSNLDVSSNTLLTELMVDSNQLTSLDIFNNVVLEELTCTNNKLTSLDLSKNLKIRVIKCGANQISSLDISRNIEIIDISVKDMPSINKVCVWELPFPPEGIHVEYYGSPNVYFTTDCSN